MRLSLAENRTRIVTPSNAREVSKSKNRIHLLECAAQAIHKFGYRGTTTANIQQLSGLSRGMINLHFQSKENLLLALAEDLSERYASNWQKVLLDTEVSPADRLLGLFRADLSPEVLNERDVAIWFAFRSEVSAKPEYKKHIDSRDATFRASLIEICSALKDEGGYSQANPVLAANCVIALLEGMWTDFHLHSADFDRGKAEEACVYMVRSFFPDHF
ncbi:TetR family transcriptional regulator [Rhodobacteraceae bacterium B1Z28]|uniref:TetR family transcriptional regulator n=2 Tax=Ruegeria haliotis TaxID=2747601 RepID=A0ABX2PWR4_9RHOB|nr:TetR family transcriptional regulator [Ruegeria haliotis]